MNRQTIITNHINVKITSITQQQQLHHEDDAFHRRFLTINKN